MSEQETKRLSRHEQIRRDLSRLEARGLIGTWYGSSPGDRGKRWSVAGIGYGLVGQRAFSTTEVECFILGADAAANALERKEEHCGSANYETFGVAVVVDNDRKLYDAKNAVVAKWREAEEPQLVDLADDLKDWVESMPEIDDSPGLLLSQLKSGALARIDWHGLARDWASEH